jgi:selenocysteine lyase/cysteine desulfurase
VVLRGLLFKPGDTIIYFRTVYGACEKTVEYVCNTTEARAVKIDFDVSISDKDLISKFRACIASVKSQGQTPRVALFDTISSLPGIRMPFEELVKICKEEEILSLVDGAHGVGQIPLNLAELDADFLVSNCHK